MGEVLVVTSGKGGVGKTTTAANIGTGLAAQGKKVVLMDTDIGLRNLDVVMGLENRIVYDIVDIAQGRCKLKQGMIKDKRFPDLYLIPAAQTKDKSAVTEEQVQAICNELKQEFDYIIVDCPAGIEQGFKNAIAGADKAIVVTNPEVSAVRDADRIIGLLQANGLGNPQLVLNRVRPNMVRQGDMMSVDDILEILAIKLLGVIPDDDNIVISTNRGEPTVLDQQSLSGKAYRNIVQRLLGNEVPLMNLDVEEGFFARLLKLFKGN